MSEAKFRRCVLALLRPLGGFAVENANHAGTPDVCCVAGWLELKVVKRPSHLETIVPIDLRKSQRLWHKKWFFHGGRSWVLTRMDEEYHPRWLLHTGSWASDHIGSVATNELIQNALHSWIGEPANPTLIDALLSSRARLELWKN